MAYSHPSLYRVGPQNSNGPTLWTYTSVDTVALIRATDYFLAAADDLTVGDVIFAYADSDGTPALQMLYVNLNDGTNVDVTDGTAISATDTD